MSTKVMYTPREEDKQEIQKQLGCMNGIFQLFDRRYLPGQRRQKNLLPQGQSESGNTEFTNASEKPKENQKTANKVAKEKHRVSVESSRNSFSSSCSSLDCSKRVQTEQSSFCPSLVSEPSSPTSRKQPDLSVQPADIRDVVKDSMIRKPRVVPVKTVAKDERKGPTMTHVDSPRPLQQHPKPVSYDRKDQNLAKLREISRGVKEVKEISRFSCDGRESPYKLKSIKELPRLSLDSKQSSIRNRSNESRRILMVRETQGGGEPKIAQTMDQTHEPGSNKRPPSSVVARLMGLEVLHDFMNEHESLKIKPCLDDEMISLLRSKKGEKSKHNMSVSPQRGIGNAIARIPLEPAPWKQEGAQKQPAKNKKAPERVDHGCHSVYGEIEKRLTEVEFNTSGKDLRALKQILEAIQRTKMRLEKKDQDLDDISSNQNQNQNQNQKNVQPVSPRINKIRTTVIKPANLASDSMVITSLQRVKKVDHTGGRNGRQSTRNTTPVETKAIGRTRKSMSPSRNSGTVSPRLQRSKDGVHKPSICGPSANGRLTVSDSNTRNTKTRSINRLQSNETSCRYRSDTRDLSQQGDTGSFPSESDTSVTSQNEIEVTRMDWTGENNGVYQPRENHKNKYAERLIEYKPVAEVAMPTIEQPSPVSVLDAFYMEDAPSPIQKKSYAFKDDEDLHFDEPEWNQVGIDSTEPDESSSRFNHLKIENIKHIVHQIELLNSSNEEAAINHSEFVILNEDHKYIKEILVASGFLKNLDHATTIVHLHPTASLINPELFNVLERTKRNAFSEKSRRKMIFDTVNNIVVEKLARSASCGLWTSKRKGGILNGEKLLKELWSEINNLQTNVNTAGGLYDDIINIISADVNKRSEDWDWDDNCNEVPGLVLDIERLIFKDLISEIVGAKVTGLQDGPERHSRQLFLL